MSDEDFQKLLDYALKLLSFRPRSTYELKKRLTQYTQKHKLPIKLIELVIANLTEHKFLNDEEFARWWVGQRKTFRPKGDRLIALELSGKGIDKETVVKVTSDTSSEFEDALKVVTKKKRLTANLSPFEAKRKISAFLSRRGFGWDTIERVIDEMKDSPYNGE